MIFFGAKKNQEVKEKWTCGCHLKIIIIIIIIIIINK